MLSFSHLASSGINNKWCESTNFDKLKNIPFQKTIYDTINICAKECDTIKVLFKSNHIYSALKFIIARNFITEINERGKDEHGNMFVRRYYEMSGKKIGYYEEFKEHGYNRNRGNYIIYELVSYLNDMKHGECIIAEMEDTSDDDSFLDNRLKPNPALPSLIGRIVRHTTYHYGKIYTTQITQLDIDAGNYHDTDEYMPHYPYDKLYISQITQLDIDAGNYHDIDEYMQHYWMSTLIDSNIRDDDNYNSCIAPGEYIMTRTDWGDVKKILAIPGIGEIVLQCLGKSDPTYQPKKKYKVVVNYKQDNFHVGVALVELSDRNTRAEIINETTCAQINLMYH